MDREGLDVAVDKLVRCVFEHQLLYRNFEHLSRTFLARRERRADLAWIAETLDAFWAL